MFICFRIFIVSYLIRFCLILFHINIVSFNCRLVFISFYYCFFGAQGPSSFEPILQAHHRATSRAQLQDLKRAKANCTASKLVRPKSMQPSAGLLSSQSNPSPPPACSQHWPRPRPVLPCQSSVPSGLQNPCTSTVCTSNPCMHEPHKLAKDKEALVLCFPIHLEMEV